MFEHGLIKRSSMKMAEDNRVQERITALSSARPRSLVREWRLKSYWSEYIPQCSLLRSRIWRCFLPHVSLEESIISHPPNPIAGLLLSKTEWIYSLIRLNQGLNNERKHWKLSGQPDKHNSMNDTHSEVRKSRLALIILQFVLESL